MSFFCRLPYPTATTSSSPMASTSMTIFREDLPARAISCDFIPTNETCKVSALAGKFNLKLPSASVTKPIVVPFTRILAPGMGWFVLSTTLPVICFCCCTVAALPSEDGGLMFARALIEIRPDIAHAIPSFLRIKILSFHCEGASNRDFFIRNKNLVIKYCYRLFIIEVINC